MYGTTTFHSSARKDRAESFLCNLEEIIYIRKREKPSMMTFDNQLWKSKRVQVLAFSNWPLPSAITVFLTQGNTLKGRVPTVKHFNTFFFNQFHVLV
jgi:hypothetical protein